jgi:O-antigen/teichoic acid export membrane protein
VSTFVSRARNFLGGSDQDVFARSLTINVAGRLTSMVLGFVSSVALARLLGPSDRGLLGVMLSVSTIALAVTAIGQPLAVTYYASRKDADNRGILGNTMVHAVLLAAVLVPLTYAFYKPVQAAFGHHHGGRTWVLVAALVPITFLDWTSSNQLLGMLRFGLYNGLKFVAGVFYTVAVLVLLDVFHAGVAGGLIATAIGSIVTIVVSVGPILRRKLPRINRQLLRGMLRYGSRVQIGVIFQMVNYRFDVVIMQFYRPLRQVGYYVVAQTIAELVITLATAFQSSLLPLVSHFEGQDRQREVTTASIRHHGILALAGVLFNAGLGTAVILLAYGAKFHPAVAPMIVLLPGIWFLGLGLVIQSDLGGRGRPGLSSALAGMAAAVTAILDVALIPPLGVMGGAIASVIAYTTFGVASLIALRRVSGIPARELVVPKREDLALYARFARRGLERLGLRRPAGRVARDRFGRRHSNLVVFGLGLIGAAASVPLISRPLYAVLLIAAAIALWLASKSVLVPLAMGTVPPLVTAILGYDPLPKGGFTLLFSAWILLAVGLVVLRGRHHPALRALMCVPVLASAVLLGMMLVRLGVSPDQSYGSKKLQLYVADVLIFFVGAVFVGVRRRDIDRFLLVSLLIAGAGALLFLGNLVLGHAHANVGGRYSLSAQEYPIELGRDSATGLMIAIYLMLTTISHRIRTLALFVSLPLAIAMLAAGSRGPVLAFAFGLGWLLALTAGDARVRRRLGLVAGVFVAAAIVVPLAVPGSAVGRALSAIIGGASGLSSNGRSSLWALGITVFWKHLWLGLGTGGFAALGTGLDYPHNILLEFASEVGIIGGAAVLAVLVASFGRLISLWRGAIGPDKLLAALLVALFVMSLVNSNFSGAVQDNGAVWLWAGVGIGMSSQLAAQRREERARALAEREARAVLWPRQLAGLT